VLDIVRGDWERAHRALEEQKQNPRRYRQLLSAVDAVTQALRTRVGQTYTLEQLAGAYADVERWGRDAVEENAPYEGWARDLALVEDAAFHDYARGALDFEP
jgi:NADPH-dependent glutamate synthase beta subunit-like oxidoreductase